MTDIFSGTCGRCDQQVYMLARSKKILGQYVLHTTAFVCSKASSSDIGSTGDMDVIIVNQYPPCWCPFSMEIKLWQDGIKNDIVH